jgi:hypothetical protein
VQLSASPELTSADGSPGAAEVAEEPPHLQPQLATTAKPE